MLIVLTTTATADEAEELAEKIVTTRLAACVQILPRMTSIYLWNDSVQKEAEYLLLIKTTAERFDELQAFIQDKHSYDVPEIVALESQRVSEPYREWLEKSLS